MKKSRIFGSNWQLNVSEDYPLDWLSRSSPWKIFSILGCLYFLFLFPSPEYNSYNKDDASWFLTLGINLAEFGRYTVDTFPVEDYGHHATWPFAFPALLAVLISIFGVSWIALKLLMVSLGLGSLYLLQCLWSKNDLGIWTLVLVGLNPVFFLFSHITMSEVPFIFATVASLLVIERTSTITGAVVAGLLATLAFFTRGYAVIFLPAGLLYYFFQFSWPIRKRVTAAVGFMLPIFIGITGWWLFTTDVIMHLKLDWITDQFGNGGGQGLVERLVRPLREYAQEIYWYHLRFVLHMMFPIISLSFFENDLFILLSIGVVILVGMGWILSVRAHPSVVEFWFPFAIALLLISGPSPRYWLTVLPFLYFYFLVATCKIVNCMFKMYWVFPLIKSSLLVVMLINLGIHLWSPDQLRFLNSYWQSYRDVAVWSREHLPDEAVIVAHHSHNFYGVGNRRVYSMETLQSGVQPQVLEAEPHVYVLYPIPDHDKKLPYPVLQTSRELLRTGEFLEVHREREAVLYKWINAN